MKGKKCKKRKIKYKMQSGGYIQFANNHIEPTIEIENDEYVFDVAGLSENDFKLLDSTNKKFISPFGFKAKGLQHKAGNEGGIKVNANKGYIASDYLGVNGKRASKNNPSVAELMLKNGGKILASNFKKDWDKFGINSHNPKSVEHHLLLMNAIKNDAEMNKKAIEAEEQTSIQQALMGLDINSMHSMTNDNNMLTKKQKNKLPKALQQAILNSRYLQGGMVPMYGTGGGYNQMAPFFGANDQRMTMMNSPLYGVNTNRTIMKYPMARFGGMYPRAMYGAPVPTILQPEILQMGGMAQMGQMPQGMPAGEPNPSQQRMQQYTGQPPIPGMEQQQQGMEQQQGEMQEQLMNLAMALVQGDPQAEEVMQQLPPEVQEMVIQMAQQIAQEQGGQQMDPNAGGGMMPPGMGGAPGMDPGMMM